MVFFPDGPRAIGDLILRQGIFSGDGLAGRIWRACCRKIGARVCNPQRAQRGWKRSEYIGFFARPDVRRITNPRSGRRNMRADDSFTGFQVFWWPNIAAPEDGRTPARLGNIPSMHPGRVRDLVADV